MRLIDRGEGDFPAVLFFTSLLRQPGNCGI